MAKQLNPEMGRTVIIRNQIGEVLISSSYESDSLKSMLNLAKEEYERRFPSYTQ